VLRRIFGAEKNEVTVRWNMLYNEELHSLYSSPDVIRMIKSGRIRWIRKSEGKNPFEDPGVNVKIISKCILGQQGYRVRIGFSVLKLILLHGADFIGQIVGLSLV
jgi:hypothetical protein